MRVDGRWNEQPGVVQTVWQSSTHDAGGRRRTEVVVRFHEGGGWFKEEDVHRIGSSGEDPQPLWHNFPESVRDVSEAVARKKQRDDLTINDILAGEVSAEQAAWRQVQRQRAATLQDPSSQVRH